MSITCRGKATGFRLGSWGSGRDDIALPISALEALRNVLYKCSTYLLSQHGGLGTSPVTYF